MEPTENTAVIEARSLTYAYPDGREALSGVDLTVYRGEKVAIIGPNGAGKSTFLLHLNGILRGEGHLSVMSHRVDGSNGRSVKELRAMVGLVFQDPDDQLFSPTIYEDVAFGPLYMGLPPDDIDHRVKLALESVGLSGYEDRLPFNLSGGEKKRAAIATVLSMSPEILVLDEPSAGLDPRSRRGLIRLLDSLDKTVLITTHDMHMVKEVFPRLFIMDGGRVVAGGPTADILADRELLERHGLELP